VHIDGQKISEGEECKLRHGSRIILGSCSYVAVVMIPQEAATDTAPGYCFKHPTYEEAVVVVVTVMVMVVVVVVSD